MESWYPPTAMITSAPNPIFELFDAFRRSKAHVRRRSAGRLRKPRPSRRATAATLAEELTLDLAR